MFPGTKPLFSLKKNQILQTYNPQTYDIYDNPRILRFIKDKFRNKLEVRELKQGIRITEGLIYQIKKYSADNGAELIILNMDAENKLIFNKDKNVLGMSVMFDDKRTVYISEENYHPNLLATSKMVDIFIKKMDLELMKFLN